LAEITSIHGLMGGSYQITTGAAKGRIESWQKGMSLKVGQSGKMAGLIYAWVGVGEGG
jgi:hypothetical protein